MPQQGTAARTGDGRAGQAGARLRATITRAAAGPALVVAVALVSLQRPVARGTLLIALLSVVLAYAVAPLVERLAAPGRPQPRLGRAGAVMAIYGCLLVVGLSAWGIAAGPFRRELAVSLQYRHRLAGRPPSPAARTGHAGIVLGDGQVLVLGGSSSGGTGWDTADLFDPATGVHGPAGVLWTARTNVAAVALPDGGALVVGGDTKGCSRTRTRWPTTTASRRSGA